MSAPNPGAVRAAAGGIVDAIRAPGLVLAVLLLTVLSAIPFAFVVESAVLDSLALQPGSTAVGGSEVDPEWWSEFSRHASGLAATFTPAILGFAAPLDSVSGLLDGTRRPLALAAPVALSALLWVFLWGGVIHRFASGDRTGRGFIAAGARHFVPLLAITMVAAAISAVLYLTLHALLFGPVYGAAAARLPSEASAFAVRAGLYLVFGATLVLANAVVSFARIEVVAGGRTSVSSALGAAWAFVRSRAGAVFSIYAIVIVLLAAAMIAYGAAELYGGSRVGGWRAVVIGQAFIALRLALRLALAAAQVRLAR